jgi:hypothetical protein
VAEKWGAIATNTHHMLLLNNCKGFDDRLFYLILADPVSDEFANLL